MSTAPQNINDLAKSHSQGYIFSHGFFRTFPLTHFGFMLFILKLTISTCLPAFIVCQFPYNYSPTDHQSATDWVNLHFPIHARCLRHWESQLLSAIHRVKGKFTQCVVKSSSVMFVRANDRIISPVHIFQLFTHQ